MAQWQCEPTLDEALADPLVQSLMAADSVDPKELADSLGELAEQIRLRDETE